MAVTLKANFEIYNEEAVKRLQRENPDLLPTYSVDKKKDLAYNKKQVTAAITSAIIQGKSVDKIASDLQSRMTTINKSGAIKTARTAITSAQNGGTLASMKELATMGIEVQKEWVATLDDRTRPSHRALDGQRRDLDEAFSNGLQYPGDSSGSADEVWWCRCTMVSYIPEYDSEDEPRLTYSEWEQYKNGFGVVEKTGVIDDIRQVLNNKKETSPDGQSDSAEYEVDNLHPATLGGARRTAESMTFEEADSFNVNPNYSAKSKYSRNCQSCVIAFEARERGYDVEAKSYHFGSAATQIALDTCVAWIDPETGEHPTLIKLNAATATYGVTVLDSLIEEGKRYTLEYDWKTKGGHIVNLDRNKEGKLRIKDNQRGEGKRTEWIGLEDITEFLMHTKVWTISVLRIDNLQFNEELVNKVLKAREYD